VVVIDDDPAVVAAMCALFSSWGARVAGGSDAPEALRAAGGGTVDLIVADLRLADGRSGIAAIGDLRRAFGHATPALIVSGDTSDRASLEARAAGITLLAKPVVAAALRAAAETVVAADERAAPVGCLDAAR
jgi:CheY-like chemotaxis protein